MAIRNFHWSSVFDCVMHETDGASATIATYTHEPEQFGPLLSENRSGTEFCHHYDALGTTTFMTNDAGAVTDTFLSDAWGNSISRTGTTGTPYHWGGRWGYQRHPLMSTHYIRARSLDSLQGRWTSVDSQPERDSTNLYMYVYAQCIGLIDPSGLQSLLQAAAVTGFDITLEPENRKNWQLRPECPDIFVLAQWRYKLNLKDNSWPCRSDTGWMVQKVTIDCETEDCVNEPVSQQYSYFEAWKVDKVGDPGRVDDARFSTRDGLGSYNQSAVNRFFCEPARLAVGPANWFELSFAEKREFDKWSTTHNSYGDPPCRTTSGGFKSIKGDVEPSFWTRCDQQSGPQKTRSLKVKWCCCMCKCQGKPSADAEPDSL